jgi:hypothetical protein
VSSENVEFVRRHYEAWNDGDLDRVVAAFAPDIEWHGHPRLPEPGPYRGRLRLGAEGVIFFAIYPADVAAGRAGLNEAAMETLVLRVQEGLDQEAIARRLGASESDVSSCLERAFERLRGLAPREASR